MKAVKLFNSAIWSKMFDEHSAQWINFYWRGLTTKDFFGSVYVPPCDTFLEILTNSKFIATNVSFNQREQGRGYESFKWSSVLIYFSCQNLIFALGSIINFKYNVITAMFNGILLLVLVNEPFRPSSTNKY